MSISDFVQRGATAFADAEEAARKIKDDFRSFRKMLDGAREAGVIGYLESQTVASECDALATEFEAKLFALHRKLTLRAQELGVDLPAPRDGGGGR